jgi:hypothetical protein
MLGVDRPREDRLRSWIQLQSVFDKGALREENQTMAILGCEEWNEMVCEWLARHCGICVLKCQSVLKLSNNQHARDWTSKPFLDFPYHLLPVGVDKSHECIFIETEEGRCL